MKKQKVILQPQIEKRERERANVFVVDTFSVLGSSSWLQDYRLQRFIVVHAGHSV